MAKYEKDIGPLEYAVPAKQEQKRPQNCGTSFCSCIECVMEQEQGEPVAWMKPDALCDRSCMYVCTEGFTKFPECATTPQQRTWVGLSYEEAEEIYSCIHGYDAPKRISEAIEAKLKEKNT